MAGNTRPIVKDLDSKPAPQYYNPTLDAYEYLQGRNGANRVELYGPDGNPLGTTEGKLNVRASEIEAALAPLATEAKLEAVRALLASLAAEDYATQTTLAQLQADMAEVKQKLTDGTAGVSLYGSKVELVELWRGSVPANSMQRIEFDLNVPFFAIGVHVGLAGSSTELSTFLYSVEFHCAQNRNYYTLLGSLSAINITEAVAGGLSSKLVTYSPYIVSYLKNTDTASAHNFTVFLMKLAM